MVSPKRHLSPVTIALVIGAVVLVAILWHKSIRHHLHPRNFGIVEEGKVYRAGRLTPTALEKLSRDRSIKTVIDFRDYQQEPTEGIREERTCAALGLHLVNLPMIGDGTGDPSNYVRALQIMNDPERQPVLVHCAAGAQRTGACIALYESIVLNRDDDEIRQDMSRFGHDSHDNTTLGPYLEKWAPLIESSYRGEEADLSWPAPEGESESDS